MSQKNMSRRRLLKLMGLGLAGTTLAACQPKVVEKVVKETVVVEKEVEKEVEKVVKETVVVKEEVEKVVEVTKAPGERIRVTWYAWGNPLDPGRYTEYEKAFDDYGLDVILQAVLVPGGEEYYVKLMAAVASGTAPDCCSL
ncbi:MAG: hypothetical protein U9R48_07420, partial [Chloroflexota bacterium]|nr:hypothetical protein [Chloroflexota bacterium]